MKSYKLCKKEYIGSSDIASLVLRGCSYNGGPELTELHFGGDNSYSAYIVDAETEIPGHYSHIVTFASWLWIYDDNGLTARYTANRIEVYRAGEMGCIIKLVNKEADA